MKKSERAFTLIEIMITVAIMGIISGVIFFSFPRLNHTVLLNRAAREFTLALREAQSKATAIAATKDPCTDGIIFPPNYGVHIKDDGETFFLFTDVGCNNNEPNLTCDMKDRSCDEQVQKDIIDNAPVVTCNGECIKRFTFTHGVKVEAIKKPYGSDKNMSTIDILFYRPDPTTKIADCDGPGTPCDENAIGPYEIRITRPDPSGSGDLTRTITVWTTGQISITK